MPYPKIVILIGHSYMATENRKQLDSLARHAKVLVLSPRTWHEAMSHFDFPEGIVEGGNWHIHFMREVRFPAVPQSQYLLGGLMSAIKSYRPDLIHIESDPWTLFAVQAIAARNRIDRRIPVVCTAKQNTYTKRGALADAVKHAIGKWGVGNTARFIAVSNLVPPIYAHQFRLPEDRFDLNTHLGIDVRLFRPPADNAEKDGLRRKWVPDLPPESILLGYCGRLEPYKGISDLIDAAAAAKRRSERDIHLLILGDGSMKDELQNLSMRQSFIHLFPRVPHAKVAGFLKTLDLFVMPSRRIIHHEEHDAHAVIEAMSCGIPCIGTDSGAIPGVMEGTGTIVPSSDIGALTEAIFWCISQSRDANSKIFHDRSAGRMRIMKQYSTNAVADRNMMTYKRAMDDWLKRTR